MLGDLFGFRQQVSCPHFFPVRSFVVSITLFAATVNDTCLTAIYFFVQSNVVKCKTGEKTLLNLSERPPRANVYKTHRISQYSTRKVGFEVDADDDAAKTCENTVRKKKKWYFVCECALG